MGVEQNGELHQAFTVAPGGPARNTLTPTGNATYPLWVIDHDVARTGRIAELDQSLCETLHLLFNAGPVESISENQAVILIGLEDLFTTPFATHHHQTAVRVVALINQEAPRLGHDAAIKCG